MARLIAVTGYGQPADRARSAAAGFDHHLVKPVDPAGLTEAIQSRAARATAYDRATARPAGAS